MSLVASALSSTFSHRRHAAGVSTSNHLTSSTAPYRRVLCRCRGGLERQPFTRLTRMCQCHTPLTVSDSLPPPSFTPAKHVNRAAHPDDRALPLDTARLFVCGRARRVRL